MGPHAQRTTCSLATGVPGGDRDDICGIPPARAVVKALAAERRTGGGVTSGLALTLVVVMDERDASEVEAAVSIAASRHPMRVLMVLRHSIEAPVPRLDAEVSLGGRLWTR